MKFTIYGLENILTSSEEFTQVTHVSSPPRLATTNAISVYFVTPPRGCTRFAAFHLTIMAIEPFRPF